VAWVEVPDEFDRVLAQLACRTLVIAGDRDRHGGAQLRRSHQLAAEVLQPANAGDRGVDASPAQAGPI